MADSSSEEEDPQAVVRRAQAQRSERLGKQAEQPPNKLAQQLAAKIAEQEGGRLDRVEQHPDAGQTSVVKVKRVKRATAKKLEEVSQDSFDAGDPGGAGQAGGQDPYKGTLYSFDGANVAGQTVAPSGKGLPCSRWIQAQLQKFFRALAALVVTHPNRLIWSVVLFVNICLPGALLGHAELRNEETVLPQDSREIEAMKGINAKFGPDFGQGMVIFKPTTGGDMLEESRLMAMAAAEEAILGLKVKDPATGTAFGYSDVCYQQKVNATVSNCFYASIFGPGTPWNPSGALKPVASYNALRSGVGIGNRTVAGIDTIHQAVSSFYASQRENPMVSSVFGKIVDSGQNRSAHVSGGNFIKSMSHLRSMYLLKGVVRDNLAFRVYDAAFGGMKPMSREERWEKAFLEYAEQHENLKYGGVYTLQITRTGTRSVAWETLQMALWSMPLVAGTMNVMISYVVWVFMRRPFKVFFKPRLKLAIAGVMGVQLASISGICFATMVQVPATFGAQFVMFLVLGIGLDGVFLMTDTFDNAPADLTLEERIQFTMCHAGPSIFIASLTDICAFLTAAFTPIPLITYFCITVAFALTIALVILNTWFVAWLYRLEKARMAAAKEAGDDALAQVNGGVIAQPSMASSCCKHKAAPFILSPVGKVLVILISLALVGTAPIGVSQVTPKYGIKEFVLGCGVFCDPSYMVAFVDDSDAGFDTQPLLARMMINNFDINLHKEKYQVLMQDLVRGYPKAGKGPSGQVCKGSCLGDVKATAGLPVVPMKIDSWYTEFRRLEADKAGGCGDACTVSHVKAFLLSNPMYAEFVSLPTSGPDTAAVLPAMMFFYPFRQYTDTTDSMNGLEAVNDIFDAAKASSLEVTSYTPWFAAYSMYLSIRNILYSSLAMALGVAFVIMLLSVDVAVALIISIVVVMVDFDLFAAIYFFDNNLAPFSYAAVVISVGLCLDYSIHLAQEFMISDKPTGNERAQEALERVGKAVMNGGMTTFLGMAILSTGPGKAFYGFGTLFCYMVVLGVFHGLCVLPVLLSIVNPASISSLIKAPKNHGNSRP